MSKWKEYRLGNIASFSYGKLPKQELLGKGEYVTYSGYKYLEAYPEYNCEKGAVILVARGVGGTGDVKLTTKRCFLTNLSIKIDLDNRIVLNDYFYNMFRQENLRYLDSGSAQSQITIQDLSNVIIEVPSIDEQKRIAGVLSSLDDKIDLLHRENATLEALAETLFRHYFIENPNPAWKEGKLTDFIKIIGGGTPKTNEPSYWNGDIGWLSGGDISGNHKNYILNVEKYITQKGVDNCSVNVLPENSMIISARGTVGKYCLLGRPMAFSQSNYGILPKINGCYFFTYLLVSRYVEEMKNAAYGSVFDTITTKTFESIGVFLPNEKEVIVVFDNQVKPIFEKLKRNQLQIQALLSQRDTLLPRLMTGEVKLVEW